ncbi:MAG TPA: hypothetical protein O0X14_02895, partial [Methanocorpusculum sp.]|nr:hypothetical protein [Methanocorpusculum sp.]
LKDKDLKIKKSSTSKPNSDQKTEIITPNLEKTIEPVLDQSPQLDDNDDESSSIQKEQNQSTLNIFN